MQICCHVRSALCLTFHRKCKTLLWFCNQLQEELLYHRLILKWWFLTRFPRLCCRSLFPFYFLSKIYYYTFSAIYLYLYIYLLFICYHLSMQPYFRYLLKEVFQKRLFIDISQEVSLSIDRF